MADANCALTYEENVALNASLNANSTKVEISQSGQKVKRRNNVKIYTAIIVVLLVSCAVLLGLLLAKQSGQTAQGLQNGAAKTNTSNANISGEVCLTEECVYTAAEILHAIDKTVDPCEDFYTYACGGWIKNNPIQGNLPYWNQPVELRQKNNNLLKRLVVDKKTRQKYSENEAVIKMFSFYDACVNTSQIDRVKGLPLKRLMAKYGSWNVTDKDWNEQNWNFIKSLANMHRELGIMPLFKVAAEPDYKDSSRNILTLNQPTQLLSRKTFLGTSQHDLAIKKAYLSLMKGLVSLVGDPAQNYGNELQEIFLFEGNLSKISIPQQEMSEKSTLYKAKTVRELIQETNGKINWLEYLRILCTDVKYEVENDTVIATFALSYLKELASLVEKTPKRIIANYMMWQVVRTRAIDLSQEFTNEFEVFNRIATGSTEKRPGWQSCLLQINSDNNELGDPMGLVFIQETFRGDNKKLVVEMINNIRDTFIENLRTLDWMDDTTKKAAEKKAKALVYNIGYPDYLLDKDKLTKKYAKLSIDKNNYFNNVLELARFTMHIMLDGLTKPTSKSRWNTHPQTINAFYDVNNNKMVFPAGILQSPFYRKYPRSVSYGGIGSVISHEITHGFDNNGRRFNSNGDLKNWWTQASNDAFERKTQCMISQYSNFTVYGRKTNGKQTLGENIADNNAILQSFQIELYMRTVLSTYMTGAPATSDHVYADFHCYSSYKKWQKKNKREPALPGIKLSHDQLFFISAAQIDCGNMSPEYGRLRIDRGTHSIEYVRVTGEMRNSKDFAATFSCPEGSPMNPKKKCKVW